MSLTTLGAQLREVGRREDTLTPAEEAVGIYRRLAEAGNVMDIGLAGSLSNLGMLMSEVERLHDGLAPAGKRSRSAGGWPTPTLRPTCPTSRRR